MGQYLKMCGLAGAGALLVAATPVFAGGHVAGSGFAGHGGIRIVRPGGNAGPVAVVRPGQGPAFRPGYRPGPYAGYYPRRQNFFGAQGRFGYDFGYAYPRRQFGPGFGSAGFFPGSDVSIAMPPPAGDGYGYPPYPLGYSDASYGPTGYGVSYNVPPTGWAPAKIIYIRGNHVRRETYFRPRQTVIVRGAASVD